LGAKLVRRLLQVGVLTDAEGRPSEIERIVACDVAPAGPAMVTDPRVEVCVGDFSTAQGLAEVIDGDVNLVFHLAGVVSGGAEADFDLGMKVNWTEVGTCSRRCDRPDGSRASSSQAPLRFTAATCRPSCATTRT